MNKECPRCKKSDKWSDNIGFEPMERYSHPCGLEYCTMKISRSVDGKETKTYSYFLKLDKYNLYWNDDLEFNSIWIPLSPPIVHENGVIFQKELQIKDLPIDICLDNLKGAELARSVA